ncbi:MAG: LysE family transporter, partial [Thermoanaerobaculia bacterium]|nr:LysE family transporter [Thermoanaerobaculia bacterium]
SFAVLGRVPESFLAGLTVAGGVFVAWIGVQTILEARGPLAPGRVPPASTDRRYAWRGAVVNLLSPHPWIFWFTVGTPLMIERWSVVWWEPIAFLTIFLGLLVGCKVAIAWATSHGRRFAGTPGHRRALVVLGLLLIAFAVWLAWQGIAGLLGL